MSVSKTHKGFAKKVISVFVLLLMTISIFGTTFAAISITESSADGGGTSTQSTTPTSISLNKSSMTLYVGDRGYLSATISPSSAKATVYWLSTNTSVAYASGGTVEAKAPGTATITAKISDTIKARCTVTVLAKPKCNSTGTLSGHEQYLSYAYSNKKVSTHDTTVKCSSCNTSWTLTGVNHIFSNAVCRKCGYRQQATGVTISQTSANVYVGSTVSLTASLTPSGSAGTIQWLSTNPSIASVSNGTVKGVAAGTATITAKVSDTVKARCTVTVSKVPKCSSAGPLSGHDQNWKYSYTNVRVSTHDTVITCSTCNTSWTVAGAGHTYVSGSCDKCGHRQQAAGISLSRTSATIVKGNTLNITATITPSGSAGTIQWFSTNTDVVYARKNGETGAVLEAKGVGTATVTAKISDSIKATCSVTVSKEPKCGSAGPLSGHDQNWKYSYTNIKASTHDTVITCSTCNTSWTVTGAKHTYVSGSCNKCGHRQQATGISLSRTSATIVKGNTLNITATITPSGSAGTIQWFSTNTDVVYARKNGETGAVLEAKGVGTATVTAKISDSIKATCVVTVSKEPKCSSTGTLSGHEQYLSYSYSNKKVSTHDTTVKCSSCNTSWMLTGVNHIFSNAVCRKCGYRQQATGISLSKTSARITVGNTTNITATITPSGSAGTIQWFSTNTDVVYARKNGETGAVLEAKGVGTATVTAKISDSIKATCSVTVVKTEVPVCSSEKVLSGHDQYLRYEYSNKKADTHDVKITCTTCNESWSSKGINHIFVNLVCNKCGYKQQPTGITLNKTSATINVGNTLDLTASLTPAGTEGTIQWLSSKTSVATVSKGTVKAVAAGTATITAKYSETVKATCVVTVVKVPKCNESNILAGHEQYLTYEYSNKKANTHDVKITCTTCNEPWLKIAEKHTFAGIVCEKCGYKQQPTGITLNKTSAILVVDNTLNLTASLSPTGTEGTIKWLSSKTSIATVSNGVVKGIAPGKVTITAKISDAVKATCEVTVVEKVVCNSLKLLSGHDKYLKYEYSNKKADTHDVKIICVACDVAWYDKGVNHMFVNGFCNKCGEKQQATAVVMSQTSANIREEETLQLTASIIPTTVIDKIVWESSNAKVATVNSNGLVTGVKEGTAKITAKASNGVKSVCTVVVSEKEKCSLGNILVGHDAKIKVEYSNSKGDTHNENFSCTECDTSWKKEKIEHSFVNGFCVCGKEENHKYEYTKIDEMYHKITCLTCNYNENVEHTVGKDVCECGYSKKDVKCEHPSYEWTTIKEAICNNPGIDVEKCTECGEVRESKTVEVEHQYKPVQIEGDAICHIGVCKICGEEGNKEIHIFGIYDKCIICKYERAPVKCQDGNVILYHSPKVVEYKELDEENHIAVFECKKCKDEFEVQGKHIFMFGTCIGCKYKKVLEGVCTSEKTIEGHEHKVENAKPLEDGKNHIITYKCEVCNISYEKTESHVFGEDNKCECGTTVDVASFYSNGTGSKKVKDNGGITTGTDQKLSKKAAKAAIEENDAVDFTAFSSGLHNLETFVNAYKDVAKETGETKQATVRLIEPAYAKIGGDRANPEGTYEVFAGNGKTSQEEIELIKQNVKIELVIGEKGGPDRESTYQATIELYVKLRDAGYNVELYAVNQDTVKINGQEEKCINIEYTPKRASQHETAQDAAIEYWKLEK